MPTIYVNAERRPELEALIRSLPALLAGKTDDPYGIARGFRLRVAFAFFMVVKEEFIVKSRGGTDAAGIQWPPLSPEYLAYTRPMGRGGSGSRQPPTAGGVAPGRAGSDGFMTALDLALWRRDFAQALAWLSASEDVKSAKGHAAAIAWNKAKARGVKTKLQVFGQRDVEILRDRGILFNSISPGVLTEDGASAAYAPPSGDQLVTDQPGMLIVGTNVPYAYYHQVNPGKRPLWPKDGNLPAEWMDEIIDVAVSGLIRIGELFK